MTLKRVFRKDKKRFEYALVSKSSGRTLRWFGVRKPSKKRFLAAERQIQFFKHKKNFGATARKRPAQHFRRIRTKRGRRKILVNIGVKKRRNFGTTPISKAKQITVFHGTDKKLVDKILKEGLKPKDELFGKIYVTANKNVAREYGRSPAFDEESIREPVVLKITLPEEFIDDNESTGKLRFENLKKVAAKKDVGEGFEYEIYKPIPPRFIRLLKKQPKNFGGSLEQRLNFGADSFTEFRKKKVEEARVVDKILSELKTDVEKTQAVLKYEAEQSRRENKDKAIERAKITGEIRRTLETNPLATLNVVTEEGKLKKIKDIKASPGESAAISKELIDSIDAMVIRDQAKEHLARNLFGKEYLLDLTKKEKNRLNYLINKYSKAR